MLKELPVFGNLAKEPDWERFYWTRLIKNGSHDIKRTLLHEVTYTTCAKHPFGFASVRLKFIDDEKSPIIQTKKSAQKDKARKVKSVVLTK